MVYAHDSKSCGATLESSSLSSGTDKRIALAIFLCRRESHLHGFRERLERRSDVFVLRSKGKNREPGSRKNCVSNFICDQVSPPAQKN